MKVRADQIAQQVQAGLAQVYIVSGDEPLQVMETTDTIRQKARELGYSERQVLEVDKDFDWQLLKEASDTLSLFAEQRIIELRIPSGKPGREGSAALVDYCANPPVDTVLIITAGKLDRSASNSKWFKALDSAGVSVQCWPIDAMQLPAWIRNRLIAKGLQPDAEAVKLLVDRVEGNLLAASQEIEKLQLLLPAGPVTVQQIAEAVTDSSRFTIFDLVDTALKADVEKTTHVVEALRAEGVEPILVLWALSRELRNMMYLLEAGVQSDTAFMRLGIWKQRIPLVKSALNRLRLPQIQGLLCKCARIDRNIKGLESGRPWDEILELSLAFAGYRMKQRVA